MTGQDGYRASLSILDEAFRNELKRSRVVQRPKIARSLEDLMTGFKGWAPHLKAWEENFKNNQHFWGAEIVPPEILRLEKERLKRKAQKENCLHGRTRFDIQWNTLLKCPRCYGISVNVGAESVVCLLCGWTQRRVGRPRRR